MNQNIIDKEYEYTKQLNHKIDSIIDNYTSECHHKYIHTFEHICLHDIQLTNFGDNEIEFSTLFDKSTGLYESNQK